MTAGMAEVIAAHVPTTASNTFNAPESGSGRYCRCGHFVRVVHSAMDDSRSTDSYLDELLAAHVAEELAKAGYGLVPDVAPEYGAPFMGHGGLTAEPFGHGPVRDPNWWEKSTHMRLAGPWQKLKPTPTEWYGESNGVD